MQWVNQACIHPSRPPLKGPICSAVDVESWHSRLCLPGDRARGAPALRLLVPDVVLSDLLLEDSKNRGTVPSRLHHNSLWLQRTTRLPLPVWGHPA